MYWINIEKIGYISKISDIFDFFDIFNFFEKIMIFSIPDCRLVVTEYMSYKMLYNKILKIQQLMLYNCCTVCTVTGMAIS